MIILKEKEFHLIEMAKLRPVDIPQRILARTRRLVVDNWWYDKMETRDLYKVGLRLTLTIELNPYQGIDFDYGFIRPYKNIRQGKSTGADNDPKYEFRALHIISSISGAEGQWHRDDFKDEDFEKVTRYEDTINLEVLNSAGVIKIVRDLKLKPSYGSNINILSILGRLLK
jgi:hypothetical protein